MLICDVNMSLLVYVWPLGLVVVVDGKWALDLTTQDTRHKYQGV